MPDNQNDFSKGSVPRNILSMALPMTVAQLINIVYSITEPPLRWLRRYIRPLPLGSIYLDVSFIVLYFALVVLESVVLIVF